MLHISRRFGDTAGIADFSLCLNKGTVHGVLGAPCTGKTTLARILGGMCIPDSGSILIEGQEISIRNPRVAAAWGIGCASEESPWVRGLDLTDHLRLGSEYAPGGKLGRRAVRKLAAELCDQYGIPLDMERRADEMTRAEWLWAEILRMLMQEKDVFVLDGPDVIFTQQEMDKLASVLRKICEKGNAAVVFSRRPETVLSVCTQVTILSPGQAVETYLTSEATAEDLTRMMHGGFLPLPPEKKDISLGGIALEVRRLTVRDEEKSIDPAVELSFEVRSGEIVCLLARPDQDWDALAAALIGANRMVSGRIKLEGKDISRASVRERMNAGMAFLPRNIRESEAVDLFTLEENLALHSDQPFGAGGRIRRRPRREEAMRILEESGASDRADLDCFPEELDEESLFLALLSRELKRQPALMIVEDPTRHFSEKTAAFVRDRLSSVRVSRRAVLLMTCCPETAMQMADRILVLHEGEIMGEFDPANTSVRELGWYISGQWRQQRYGGRSIEGEDE